MQRKPQYLVKVRVLRNQISIFASSLMYFELHSDFIKVNTTWKSNVLSLTKSNYCLVPTFWVSMSEPRLSEEQPPRSLLPNVNQCSCSNYSLCLSVSGYLNVMEMEKSFGLMLFKPDGYLYT